ncbi:protein phosphatase 2C domain-containing protein [Spirosoma sp.]|uniref:PP2C family protein-serine/threonine phosphatase n=1 Tax=Spirosoma sp. TaxID=1899569 RepID=UPI00260407A6|nr:protein phosphatase 2C domain-containing protein [Spirosoma sp.]MCX6216971.1 protein phosphatase 2C domain-containing protein [Spirosoma sp.]
MDISIYQPVGFTEPGSRANNEDALFPPVPAQASIDQRWFLVCDGVGGAEKGEVASELAVTSFNTFFKENPVNVATEDYIHLAVQFAQKQFETYLNANPQATGMGTTVTLLYLHEEGATVAHIGDSRVYFIRGGQTRWRTDDHSYVNELVRSGVLTPAQASTHPQRNIITRALQSEKPVQASVQIINDIRAGDYFFLCSDGILERIGDELLEHTLLKPASNDQKLETIRQLCIHGKTRDNFTAYLIQINQVIGRIDPARWTALPTYERPEQDEAILVVDNQEPVVKLVDVDYDPIDVNSAASLPDSSPVYVPQQASHPTTDPLPQKKSGLLNQFLLWTAAGLFLLAASYFGWTTISNAQRATTTHKPTIPALQPLVTATAAASVVSAPTPPSQLPLANTPPKHRSAKK